MSRRSYGKKIDDCEQYTSFRSALSELTNVEVTYKIKEMKLLWVLCKLQKVDFLIAITQANDGYNFFVGDEKLAQYLFMLIFLLGLMHTCINEIYYLFNYFFFLEWVTQTG